MNNLAQHLANLSLAKRELLISELKKRGILEPIAIIGIGCRFPGAVSDVASYWQLLTKGVDAISEVPSDRWDIDSLYDPNPFTPGKMVTRYGGFLDQVDKFDPAFFHISPREAACIDPQQRLLMEVAWEAFEDGGLLPDKLAGTATGVFLGISTYDYGLKQLSNENLYDAYAGTGSVLSIAANRLSYLFDLHGPSFSIDTACSSSLVAVHLACQSLWRGESTLALAGGVNVMLSPALTINFTKAGFMSPDGRCKSFDARANGYVRGEGCGLILLKPLSQALADNNLIYAVVRGTAINQDGHTNGLTAPNRQAQEMVLKEAYQKANLSPGVIQYIEAHGTGTPLGDPIEAQALGAVLSIDRRPDQYCALGSVKTNIGHLEAAAGVAGIIKTALCLKHKTLVPSLHFQLPNSKIDFDKLPLRVQTAVSDWPTQKEGAYAGISSFGFGGTNAHIVLEAPPEQLQIISDKLPAYILPLSAQSQKSLQALAQQYLNYLETENVNLADLCYTASCKRTHHQIARLALVGESVKELQEKLKAFLASTPRIGLSSSNNAPGKKVKKVFVLSGQGQQWWAMARKLLSSNRIFQNKIAECDLIIKAQTGWSLLEELQTTELLSKIEHTEIAQPAIFALQIGLAAIWQNWGIKPDAVIGHSMGEIAGAYIAGAINLTDAITIIIKRGQLMERTYGQGKTALVELSLAETQQLLAQYPQLGIAAHNSPTTTVISGIPEIVDEVITKLQTKGVFCRLLRVNYAFHSPQMDALQPEFELALANLAPQEAPVAIYSTVTGNIIEGQVLNAKYWSRNLREPVLFSQTINQLLSQDYNTFIELSAHPILSGAISDCLHSQNKTALVVTSLKRGDDDNTSLLNALASIYASGASVDWNEIYPKGNTIALPHYAWQRERFWLENSSTAQNPRQNSIFTNTMKLATTPSSYVWEMEWSTKDDLYLTDHIVMDRVIVPGATYIATLWTAFSENWPANFRIESVEFCKPLFLSNLDFVKVQLIVTKESDQKAHFYFASRQKIANQESWTKHVIGQVTLLPIVSLANIDITTLKPADSQSISKEAFYQKLAQHGLQLGATFQGIQQIQQKENQALTTIQAEGLATQKHYFYLHPGVLDSCFQTLLAALDEQDARYPASTTFVPVKIDQIICYQKPNPASLLYAEAQISAGESTKGIIKGSIEVYDQEGKRVASIVGLQAQKLYEEESLNKYQRWFYNVKWLTQPNSTSSVLPPQKWLILANYGDISDKLASLATKAGHQVVMVYPGDSNKALSEGVYQVDSRDNNGLRQILELYKTEGCQTIIYLWGLGINPSQDNWLEDIERLASLPLINLIQLLAQTSWPKPPRLWLVTQVSQNLSTIVNPAQTALWGLINAINYEHPEYLATRVDLSSTPVISEIEALYKEIVANTPELQLAFRDRQRYVARLTSYSLPTNHAITIHANASYLITGGTKGLGLVIAEWLVSQGARNLLLIGRNPISENSLATVEKLRSQGAKVITAEVDITAKGAIDALIAEYAATLPPLKGIIHSAGVLADGILLHMDAARFHQVLAPKIQGGWSLHTATLAQKLDFFINFSSAVTLIGTPAQGNYTMANAFLDGLAYYRTSLGLPTITINWGPWSDVGMAASQDNRGRRLDDRGLGSISPQEGCEILALILQKSPLQLGVMNFNVKQWQQSYTRSATTPFFQELIPQSLSSGVATIKQQMELLPPGAARRSILEGYVQEQLSQILKISTTSIGLNDSLTNIGLDSLMSIELKNRLESGLGLHLSVTLVWNYPTLTALVDYLAKEMGLEAPKSAAPTSIVANLSQQETAKTLDVLAKIKSLQGILRKN